MEPEEACTSGARASSKEQDAGNSTTGEVKSSPHALKLREAKVLRDKTKYNIYWSTSERPPAGLPGEKYTNPIRCEEIGKSLSRITLRELAKIGGDSQIRHIWIDDHPYDENHHNSTSMPKDFPHAIKQSLKTLIIRGVGRLNELRNLITCLSTMASLESLILIDTDPRSAYRLMDEMASMLSNMKLKLFKIIQWNAPLPSLANMTTLEELHLLHLFLSSSTDEKLSNLRSLKKFYISRCSMDSELDITKSISQMSSLETLSLFDMDLCESKLFEGLHPLQTLKTVILSSCKLPYNKLPDSITKMASLEELDLSHTSIYWPATDLSSLTSLRKLTIHGVQENTLPQCIYQLQSLEELNLDQISFTCRSLDDKLHTLTSLMSLNLADCNLSKIPKCLTKVKGLSKLNMRDNDLSGDTALSEILSCLASVTELDLSNCKLTDIPNGISPMTSLVKLNLRKNDLSRDCLVSEKLATLTALKSLDLTQCKMTEIPQSVANMAYLEELVLKVNDLSNDRTLHEKTLTLSSLRKLNIQCCNLTEIPAGVQNMGNLEELVVSKNQMEILPEWMDRLESLRILDLSMNTKLKKLDNSLSTLSLEALNIDGSKNLTEPPYFVCQGGMKNIKLFYADLQSGTDSMTLATVAVIGRKMAGKTSLVKSLQSKKIVLTYRKDKPGGMGQNATRRVDETTKVFNFVEVKFMTTDQDHKAVKVVDFGGDEIYHHAYQLTFKKDCTPIVVVNITEYMMESEAWGNREATRRVVFDWISHLYLACPQLDRPILVLTHKDEHSEVMFKLLKEQLLGTITKLERELLQEKKLDTNIQCLLQSQDGLFARSEIFEISHEISQGYAMVYSELDDLMNKRVAGAEVSMPKSWRVIMDKIRGSEGTHISYSSLKLECQITDNLEGGAGSISSDQLEAVLDFMRRSGDILWFTETSSLEDSIFHDICQVTAMISQLFDHSVEDHHSITSLETLEKVLKNGSSDGSILPFELSIQLLKFFKLIYGPTAIKKVTKYYLIPQFMKQHTFPDHNGELTQKVYMNFMGLSIPLHAFQQMTVSFLLLLEESRFETFAYGNGASGRRFYSSNEYMIDAHFIHHPDQQAAEIRIEGAVVGISECWTLLLDAIRRLTRTVKQTWPASLIRYDLICSHCLLKMDPNPEKRSNPDFIMEKVKGIDFKPYPYNKDCKCREETNILSPIRYPCGELTEARISSLQTYVKSINPDEQDVIQWLMNHKAGPITDMMPQSQSQIYTPLTVERVYQMTSTRGRALIINNRFEWRHAGLIGRSGSAYDYTNIMAMLKKFGFVISHLSGDKNWKAQEIVEAVHQETQLVYQGTTSVHEGLGMFVLVMMSHGNTGTIEGCDNRAINLVDIYKLMSSQNFPAMRGKPKVVILESCCGGRNVAVGYRPHRALYRQPHGFVRHMLFQPMYSGASSSTFMSRDQSHLTIDDLLVMKACFDGHVACITENGSYFIRALIAAFYRYAGEKDLRTLSDMIQQTVSNECKGHGEEQVPLTISTFTNGRKLYLSPGVNTETGVHPKSFTEADHPDPSRKRLSLLWLNDGMEVSSRDGTARRTVSFVVHKNYD